jgi:hypothetical protein
MPHAGQLTAGGVDLLGEAGVEDQLRAWDVSAVRSPNRSAVCRTNAPASTCMSASHAGV